jgi:ABC-type branched-subunit amino acid transport system substrate-binding protein
MRKLFFIFHFSFFIITGQKPVLAQIPVSDERQYKAAVQLVKLGDYAQARRELTIVIQRGGSLAPFATYYHALTWFRQRDWTQSRLMLSQLLDRYPDWRRRDDAYYLLAATQFETRQYAEALANLQRIGIGDPELKADVNKLEQSFFARLTDLRQLKTLYREFPENRSLALRLIDVVQNTPTADREDLELSDRLTNRFGVPVADGTRPAPMPTTPSLPATRPARADRVRTRGVANVAVLFPFRVDAFDADQRLRANQYALDMFEGMKLAKTKLLAEGININLLAYDVDNDEDEMTELINSPSFAENDLLIGPLYAEPNRIAVSYANQTGIVLVNPLATNADLITRQPLAYLAQPSVNQQTARGVEFMRGLGGVRKAAVYFGTARKDSLLAVAYQAELKRQSFQVLDFLKMSGKGADMAAAMKISEANRPGHIFYATSNDDDGPRMLDALSRLRVGVPLLASSAGFDYYKNPASVFTRRELYLLYPDFMDTSRPVVEEFQELFLARRHTIPSPFAAQGYDMLLFFGRQLAKGNFNNRNALRTDTDDYVLSGFDYTRSNDNQIVPIVKYDNGRFTKIN